MKARLCDKGENRQEDNSDYLYKGDDLMSLPLVLLLYLSQNSIYIFHLSHSAQIGNVKENGIFTIFRLIYH